MLKAIIIDDEKLIREGLVTYIDWASLDVQICAVCQDGDGGIQAVIEHHPQIILADICLPGISGLDMFRQIRSYGLSCQVIFISSYSEFQYAQQAVKLGAFDYLLKPIEADVLYDCVRRCAQKVSSEKAFPSVNADRAVIEKVLCDALANVPQADQTFLHLCRQLGIPEGFRPFLLVTATSGDSPPTKYPEPALPGKPLLAAYNAQVSNQVRCCCFFADSAAERVLCQSCLPGAGKEAAQDAAHSVLLCCPGPSVSLYTCLQQALCQLILRFVPPHFPTPYFVEERSELVPQVIHDLDTTALRISLCQFFLFCHQHGWTLKHLDFQFECFKFLENIYKQLTQYYGLPLPTGLDMHDFIEQLRRPSNIYDLYLALSGILVTAFTQIKKDSCQSPYTKKALAIIRGRYGESLTLKSVARELHVSPSYLSAVFKEDTGCPFSDYLIRYRMNIAYALVKEGDCRIYEIGARVGYPDVAQFSKSFKKQFGCSPKQLQNVGKR